MATKQRKRNSTPEVSKLIKVNLNTDQKIKFCKSLDDCEEVVLSTKDRLAHHIRVLHHLLVFQSDSFLDEGDVFAIGELYQIANNRLLRVRR